MDTNNYKDKLVIYIILFIIFSLFIMEEYIGGSSNVIALLKMGANNKILVLQHHEFYRLFTSVYLHSGLMHLLFNSYVLFSFGSFFKDILGTKNFLLLFFTSGLCGSIASIYLGKAGVSVGASGAIWGFLGATLALSIFPSNYVAPYARSILLKTAAINIVLNLAISLLPMIDIWAHLGGGICGFLITGIIITNFNNILLQNIKNFSLSFALIIFIILNLLSIFYILFTNFF